MNSPPAHAPTFYDEVRVHKSTLLGEENKGRRVGSMSLNLDRVGAARYLISVRCDENIVNYIKKTRDMGDYCPATDEAITQMLGTYGQLLNGSPHAVRSGLFAHNLMGTFQSGINHGSVQVMRDQVARRGLGMPRSRGG